MCRSKEVMLLWTISVYAYPRGRGQDFNWGGGGTKDAHPEREVRSHLRPGFRACLKALEVAI